MANAPFYQNQNGMNQGANYQPQGWQNPYQSQYPIYNPPQNQVRLPYDNAQSNPPVMQINGRVVSSNDEIKPNEVPMDGSISLFPISDYSAIYAKQWDKNGLLQMVKYIPEHPVQSPATEQNDILSEIRQRLDNIEKKLSYRPNYKKYPNKRDSQNQSPDTNPVHKEETT